MTTSTIPQSDSEHNTPSVEHLLDEAIISIKPSSNGHGSPNPGQKPVLQLSLTPADELDRLPALRWLVKGLVSEHSLSILYGPSGARKSFIALDWALQLAQDRAVVYIAAEGAYGYAPRKIAWCNHHGLGSGQLYFITQAVNIMDPEAVTALADLLRNTDPALVVIDTLARCMLGGDENSARDMGLFIAGCDALRRISGATVLVVHHTGKNGAGERGSSALRAAADHMIEVGNDDDLITVMCTKSKDAREPEPFCLRSIVIETGRTADDGTPETSCILLPADKVLMTGVITANMRKILDALALETFREAGGKAQTLIEYTGLTRQSFYRAMSKLIRGKYVRQAAKGDPYFIEEDGLAAIS